MGRIVIADSDPHVLLLCRDELQDEGHEVLVAHNGREVLGLVEQTCPDLVVLEMLLPDMSGFETVQIIKGTCRQTPVVFHSTYGWAHLPGYCQADGIVLKTHNLDHLKRTVRQLLAARRPKSHARQKPGRGVSRPEQRGRHGVHGN